MTISLRRLVVFVHDILVAAAAWEAAMLVRYNFDPTPLFTPGALRSLAIVVLVQAVVFRWCGLYKGLWRFASTRDLWNILRGAIAGVLLVSLALALYNRLQDVPRTVLVLYPIFLVFLLGGPRLAYRLWKDHRLGPLRMDTEAKRVLVLGAGRAGEMLVRDMQRGNEYVPVGLLDDNPALHGSSIHGVPVLGPTGRVKHWAAEMEADLAVIALPSATSAEMRRMVEACEQAGIPFRTLPSLTELDPKQLGIQSLREVSLEDLLGREPVALDWHQIGAGITGKTVLVTGGGGSIGAELCRQIARLDPKALVILEHSEYNLYRIELELSQKFPEVTLHACLGDVCDRATVEHVFGRHRPDVVFHAAAYKHVPILEGHVREAMLNNVIGTQVVAEAADRSGCETFVMISTDKAVNPANVLGASKRIAEIYCQNLNFRSGTRFVTVRFGNVLGSAGSVVPLFKQQIAAGGPVTVTHPDITRYFMTIPEACQLILQAGTMGQGGEIFVLDMGEPVKIRYLAEQLIRLSGKIPGKDIEITYTGLRPGEKLYEELFYDQEATQPTGHEKILLAQCREVEWNVLKDSLKRINTACRTYDESAFIAEIRLLVPEMQPGCPRSAAPVIHLEERR